MSLDVFDLVKSNHNRRFDIKHFKSLKKITINIDMCNPLADSNCPLDSFAIIAIVCISVGTFLCCVCACICNVLLGRDACEGFCEGGRYRRRRYGYSHSYSGGGGGYDCEDGGGGDYGGDDGGCDDDCGGGDDGGDCGGGDDCGGNDE